MDRGLNLSPLILADILKFLQRLYAVRRCELAEWNQSERGIEYASR